MEDRQNIWILLVDDEKTLLEYLSKRLLRQGFTVKATFSGEEAIEAAKEEHYDVAVVDLKMPGMDGVETQRRLKEIQPFIQCIVLTGHGSIQSALESGQEDAFQYLLKPVDHDKLIDAIKKAYKRKEVKRSLVIHWKRLSAGPSRTLQRTENAFPGQWPHARKKAVPWHLMCISGIVQGAGFIVMSP